MATEESTLDINIRVKKAEKDSKKLRQELKRLEKQGIETQKGVSNLSKAFSGMQKAIAPLAVLLSAAKLGKAVFNTNVEFEKLFASLETVTGSTLAASKAFSEIEDFTTRTPYQLNQVVDAFIKLESLGLEPSMEALESYGNTASAMGKSLNQFIEAVADASTNEFERLKEFGIKARQQADTVTFTFQGVSRTVGKNSKEIVEYLREIGDTTFASGMEKQIKTLGGALSNFQDAVDALLRALGQDAGLAGLFRDVIKEATEFLNIWTKIIRAVSGTEIDKNNERIKELKDEIRDLNSEILDIEKNAGKGFAGILDKILGSDDYENQLKNNREEVKKLNTELRTLLEQNLLLTGNAPQWLIDKYDRKTTTEETAAFQEQIQTLQSLADHYQRYAEAKAQLEAEATQENLAEPYDDMDRALDLVIAQFEELNAETAKGIAGFKDIEEASLSFTEAFQESLNQTIAGGINDLADAFIEFAEGGEDAFRKMTESILRDIARIALRLSLTQALTPIFGGGLAGVGGGAAINAFAKGGVVNNPTLFGYNGSKTGVAGEKGPEAILPLQKDSKGNLGVSATGAPVIVNVINQSSNTEIEEVSSPDGKELTLIITDTVKQGFSNGTFDKSLRATYGVKRIGM